MGLHRTAHYLKTKGRDGDTELVHMTKGEVKGLQALALAHGGSLTINPDTGLPEANFLKRALPTIAGVGVGFATGNPMLGAAVAGGLTVGTGGSLVQGLMAGVGAYGGAGMLSGLAEAGAAQVAAETASQATQQAALNSGLPAVTTAAQTTPASINAAAEAMANLPSAMPPVLPAAQTTAASIDAAANAMANLPAASPIPLGSTPTQVADLVNQGVVSPQQYQAYGETYGKALETARQSPITNTFRGLGVGGPQGFSPTTGFTNLYDIVKRDPTQAAMAAAPLLTNMDTEERGAPGPADSGYASSISPNFQAYVPAQPNPYYQAQYPDYRRRTYAAEGGIMQSYQAGGPVERMSMANTAMNPQGGLYPQGMIDKTQYAVPTQRPVSSELVMDTPGYERSNPMLMNTGGAARLPKGDPGIYRDPDPSTRGLSALDAEFMRRKKLMGRFGIPMAEMPKTGIKSLGGDMSDMAAAGGMASLGGYSDGGRMLKGPGDGMSDSIPASIGNKQPARLADGEFVVPADVVSHLGNGSTDAGARKLYSMMDKIRKARTGKKRQAPAVKADRYMPA
jgi:hypothetical protein